jgi:hypothetical protein
VPPIHDLLTFYKESKKRSDTEPEFKLRAAREVVALQSGEPDVTRAWTLICDVSRLEYARVYKRLEVTNTEQGESFYQSRMVSLVKELNASGLMVRGQTCVASPCNAGANQLLLLLLLLLLFGVLRLLLSRVASLWRLLEILLSSFSAPSAPLATLLQFTFNAVAQWD